MNLLWLSAVLFAILSLPVPAMAQHMNANTFYQRAINLKKKGPLALFSGNEIRALKNEGKAAGDVAAARIKADKAAGRQPRFCPPPGPRVMGSNEFVARLGAIPQDQRARIDMVEATTRIVAKKFPCLR